MKPQPACIGWDDAGVSYFTKPPRYQQGDLLYVRETLRAESYACQGWNDLSYMADNHEVEAILPDDWSPPINMICEHWESGDNIPGGGFNWYTATVPARFMPKLAARIWLRVTDVRAERLQDITEEDAAAEGVEHLFTQEQCDTVVGIIGTKPEDHGYRNYLWHGNPDVTDKMVDSWPHQYSDYKSARDSFSSLWDSLNAKRGFPWSSNPWVWRTAFERCER
jgi:hypothetical protein